MRSARVHAQAKVNLILRVGGRGPDGYHEINTIFQRIDLADEIVVRAGRSGTGRSIMIGGGRRPPEGLGPAENNLAFRAAVAYAAHADWVRDFAIELTKEIPVGGGLGGGSADAAAVLRALDAIAPSPLGARVLTQIALTLGADVPFLTTDLPVAFAGGRGERLRAVEPLASRDVVLIVPRFGISTADAYRWLEAGRSNRSTSAAALPVDNWGWAYAERASANDFEPSVEQRFPELGEYRRRLTALGARISRLSGSGSTVFGVFSGAPVLPRELDARALVIPTRTSARVVQVEVLE